MPTAPKVLGAVGALRKRSLVRPGAHQSGLSRGMETVWKTLSGNTTPEGHAYCGPCPPLRIRDSLANAARISNRHAPIQQRPSWQEKSALPGVAHRRRRRLRPTRAATTHDPPHVRHQLDAHLLSFVAVPRNQSKYITSHAIERGISQHAHRDMQPDASGTLEQLAAAHSVPARADKRRDRGCQRPGRSISRAAASADHSSAPGALPVR